MTDHYSVVEGAIRTLATGQLTSYFTNADMQATKSDDTVYDEGYDYFFTTYPGAFPAERFANQVIVVTWEVLVDVLSRFKTNEAAAWSQFIAYRSDLFNLFNATNKGRNLDRTNGVMSVVMTSDERPRYIPLQAGDEDSPAAFIGQVCAINVEYKINKT